MKKIFLLVFSLSFGVVVMACEKCYHNIDFEITPLLHRIYKRYPPQGSLTDYKEFPSGNHGVLTDSSWRREADYILDWLRRMN